MELPIKGKDEELYHLHPTKIVCLGRNYAEHAKEFGSDVPVEPIIFVKTPTCLIENGAPIILPKAELGIERVDHEIELAAIISKTCKDVKLDDAEDYILGYTIFNDVTARDLQRRDIGNKLPWFRSKNLDTFGPIGPALVLKGELDPQDVELVLRVNGEIRQKATTKDMIFPVARLVSHISGFLTLEEGDIIATGTPEGVGPLKDGDVVEATIEPIGTLSNPVRKR